MKCPNCKCEIANMPVCPYCGAIVRRSSTTETVSSGATQTVVPGTEQVRRSGSRRDSRHLANLDTWGLMSVVLLCGIFLMEILQVVLQLVR